MTPEQPTAACTAAEQELAVLAAGGHAAGEQRRHRAHTEECEECREFAQLCEELGEAGRSTLMDDASAAPLDLVARTLTRLQPELTAIRERRRMTRLLAGKLALAGLASFPVILALNAAFTWLGYSLLSRFLPTVAPAFATMLTVTTLLGLSLSYGALPLLARWGVDMRVPVLELMPAAAELDGGATA